MESKAAFKSKVLPYLLLSPSCIVIVVFLFYPALQTFQLALYRSDPFGLRKVFVGLENFVDLLTSPDYGASVWVTFVFAAFVIAAALVPIT